jgi:hypothetical protein
MVVLFRSGGVEKSALEHHALGMRLMQIDPPVAGRLLSSRWSESGNAALSRMGNKGCRGEGVPLPDRL